MAKIGLMREEGAGEKIRNILHSFDLISFSLLNLPYQPSDLLEIMSNMLEVIQFLLAIFIGLLLNGRCRSPWLRRVVESKPYAWEVPCNLPQGEGVSAAVLLCVPLVSSSSTCKC